MVHDHPFAGHLGHFWWPEWTQDVNDYINKCDACQRNKSSKRKPAGLMQPLPNPGRLWESVGIDFITHLPKTLNGHTSIFVCIHRLNKMVHFVPMVMLMEPSVLPRSSLKMWSDIMDCQGALSQTETVASQADFGNVSAIGCRLTN